MKYPQLREAQKQPEARRDRMHFFKVAVRWGADAGK